MGRSIASINSPGNQEVALAMKQQISTQGAPTPVRPYSQGIKATGTMVFVAGQVPKDPVTGQTVGSTIEEQTERVLENVKAILEAGGAALSDVVKTSVFLTDVANAEAFDRVYARYFPEPRPVRTTVGAQLGKGFLVEVDVIAMVNQS